MPYLLPEVQTCTHEIITVSGALKDVVRCLFAANVEIHLLDFEITVAGSSLSSVLPAMRVRADGLPLVNRFFLYGSTRVISMSLTKNFIGAVTRSMRYQTDTKYTLEEFHFVVYQIDNVDLNINFSKVFNNSFQYAGTNLTTDTTLISGSTAPASFDFAQVQAFELFNYTGSYQSSFFAINSARGAIIMYRVGYLAITMNFSMNVAYLMDDTRLDASINSQMASTDKMTLLTSIVNKPLDPNSKNNSSNSINASTLSSSRQPAAD
jgi:hypothetical protein